MDIEKRFRRISSSIEMSTYRENVFGICSSNNWSEWKKLTGNDMLVMTPTELRSIANIIDGHQDLPIITINTTNVALIDELSKCYTLTVPLINNALIKKFVEAHGLQRGNYRFNILINGGTIFEFLTELKHTQGELEC